MGKIDRKSAVKAYKERKVVAGVYALRCIPTGQCWAGSTPDLSTVQNRLWFTVRQGGGPYRSLQAAWCDHGQAGFTFDEVERLPQEDDRYLRSRQLQARHVHWCAALGAERI